MRCWRGWFVLCLGGVVVSERNPDTQPTFIKAHNHGSNPSCNQNVQSWFAQTYAKNSAASAPLDVNVLDVGGGEGQMEEILRDTGAKFKYSCVDVVGSPRCAQFDGHSIPEHYADNSLDLVLFNYVLHHAGDNTIPLLQAAKRATKDYVVVSEELKGLSYEAAAMNFQHEWKGTFRGPEEWTDLFKVMGFKVERIIDPHCQSSPLDIPHIIFVLRKDTAPMDHSSFVEPRRVTVSETSKLVDDSELKSRALEKKFQIHTLELLEDQSKRLLRLEHMLHRGVPK